MTTKSIMPQIRFMEFSGDWEEKKLEELADFSKGQGYSKNDLIEAGTPIILYGRLYTKYQTTISKVDTFVIEKNLSTFSEGKEVIVPASGETAEDIARASAVTVSGFILGGDLNIIYPNDKINNVFLALNISNGKTQKDLSRRAQGKSVVHLRNADLKEVNLYYPCETEQTKIGDYFQHLDKLIEQKEKKYQKLKQFKKAMLDKIFPKNGATTPEIRFKGFAGEWEEKKLGELAEIRRGLTYKPSDVDNNGVKVLRSSNIYNETFVHNDNDVYVNDKAINIKYTNENDILITSANGSSRLVGKHAIVRNLDKKTVHGGFMLLATSKSPFFLNASMSSSWYNKFINKYVSGGNGAIGNLSKNNLEDQDIYVPNVNEQSKIGCYFQNIDKLIDLQLQELCKLKNIKKASLEKMFV